MLCVLCVSKLHIYYSGMCVWQGPLIGPADNCPQSLPLMPASMEYFPVCLTPVSCEDIYIVCHTLERIDSKKETPVWESSALVCASLCVCLCKQTNHFVSQGFYVATLSRVFECHLCRSNKSNSKLQQVWEV